MMIHVRQVIHEWNPFGLLPDAPDDEFNSEIEKVTCSLQEVSTVEDFAARIQEIFSYSFGTPFEYKRCLVVAERIWGISRRSGEVDRRHCKAMIEWERDPSLFPVHEWLRDMVVIYGEVIDRKIEGYTWTVLVRITDFADRKWMTYADVAFLVEDAPWHLFEKGYSFSLWAGKNIAKVTIL